MRTVRDAETKASYSDLPETHVLMDGHRIEPAYALKDEGKAYVFEKTILVSPEAFDKIKKDVKSNE